MLWKNVFRCFAGFDMKYEEFKELGRKAWNDKTYKYFYIDGF